MLSVVRCILTSLMPLNGDKICISGSVPYGNVPICTKLTLRAIQILSLPCFLASTLAVTCSGAAPGPSGHVRAQNNTWPHTGIQASMLLPPAVQGLCGLWRPSKSMDARNRPPADSRQPQRLSRVLVFVVSAGGIGLLNS